jgi:hypothetical protein
MDLRHAEPAFAEHVIEQRVQLRTREGSGEIDDRPGQAGGRNAIAPPNVCPLQAYGAMNDDSLDFDVARLRDGQLDNCGPHWKVPQRPGGPV